MCNSAGVATTIIRDPQPVDTFLVDDNQHVQADASAPGGQELKCHSQLPFSNGVIGSKAHAS